MSQPTAGDVHVNRLLGNISTAYIQKRGSFVADQAFPVVPVDNKSDRYPTYSKEDWMRDEASERAPGTESAGGSYEVDTEPNFFCKKYAFHKDIDDDTRANQDMPLDADRDGTLFVSQKMLLKRERVWASNYMTNVWGSNLTGVAGTPGAGEFKQWDQSGAAILKNVEDWKESIAATTGSEPNIFVCAPDVLANLKVSPEVKDTIKYTQKGVVTEQLLAELFGVEKFLVPRGVVNTAAKGKAGTFQRIVSKKILLCYAPEKPSLLTPSAGYIFSWKGYFGADKFGARIKKFRMENVESDRIEGEMAFDCKQVAADMGVYAASVIA
jgi:hypothetical protein